MSDPKATPPPSDFPAEAKRRGGMDTLFSAPWFDDAAAGGDAAGLANAPTEEVSASAEVVPVKKSNTMLLVVVGVVVLVVLPALLCGATAVLGAAYWFMTGGI